MSTEAYSPDSRDYLSVFRERKWWIIGTTAVLTGAAIAHALFQTPLYRSTAQVLVQPVAVPGPSVNSPFVNIDTELQIASSAQVAQAADAVLVKAGIEPGEVTVSTSTTTDTLEFAAVSDDAHAARATAEAYAEAYLQVRTEQLTAGVDQSLDSVAAIIKDLNGKILHAQQELASSTTPANSQFWAARISSLTSQITTDQTLQNDLFLAKSSSVGQILQPARLPQRPFSPNYVRDVLLGLFLGLLLGCGLALLRDRADRSLRGREEIEQAAGSPLIAMIPEAASLNQRLAVVGNGDPQAAEAYRSLRTKILFTASQQPFKTIMVTSPRAGEGKTTTAANVAVALAQADKKVVLVSSDLRRPTLQRYFPNMNGTGLSDVLAGTAELGSTITPGPVSNLVLISSGSREFRLDSIGLGSVEMRKVIEGLSAAADFVVLDATPVLGVSDAIDLASMVDAVILVTDAKSSTGTAIEEAANDLRSVGTSILGVVLNRFDPSKFHPYYQHAGRHPHYYATNPRNADGTPVGR